VWWRELLIKGEHNMAARTNNNEVVSEKSRLAAALLAWFLGTLGLHRLYIGKIGSGLAILILGIVVWATTWVWGLGFIFITVVGIWVFIDFLLILFGGMKDGQGKPLKNW
jgi:TM2 domain-containing membrane protein YozV